MTDDERRVLEVIQQHGQEGITFSSVSGISMPPPDKTLRAVLVLIQRGIFV